ncbi:hypothetical protein BHE74_00053472 [Ensete ventricosum]|nr:hypothetical protein BHE74_00053472 [Ensete ventricosum]
MVNDGEAEHDPQLGVADPLARRDLDPPEPAAVPSLAAVEVVLPAPLPQPLQCALRGIPHWPNPVRHRHVRPPSPSLRVVVPASAKAGGARDAGSHAPPLRLDALT